MRDGDKLVITVFIPLGTQVYLPPIEFCCLVTRCCTTDVKLLIILAHYFICFIYPADLNELEINARSGLSELLAFISSL